MGGPDARFAPLDLPHWAAPARAWVANLTAISEPASALLAALSPDERARAASFRFERDRERFVRRRWVRVRIIAAACGVAPERLRIEHDALGAPRLAAPKELTPLHLSTSSAGDIALVAISTSSPVGIDVAAIDSALGRDAAAAAVFMSVPELAWWRAATDHQRPARFFQLWTRKEAALKALGLGLQRDPRTLGVLDPDPAGGGPAGAAGLSFAFADLAPAPGSAGALAIIPAAGAGQR